MLLRLGREAEIRRISGSSVPCGRCIDGGHTFPSIYHYHYHYHWHVYTKPPSEVRGGPEHALRYLGHYTHHGRHLQPLTRFLGRPDHLSLARLR
jgi:hypothetical protein